MDQIMGRSKGLKTVLQKRQIDAGPVISYVRFTGEYILLTLGRFSLTCYLKAELRREESFPLFAIVSVLFTTLLYNARSVIPAQFCLEFFKGGGKNEKN